MSNSTATESPRRELSARAAETVEALTVATRKELAKVGYDELTVRSVAGRAGVAPATAYNYFSSKEHLVAETFWRLLAEHPRTKLTGRTPATRATQAIRDMADFLSQNKDLADAATPALLGPQPDVHTLRIRIGTEYLDRIREALGDDAAPQSLATINLAFSGAMIQAGMGTLTYEQMGDQLADAVDVIVRGAQP